MGVSRKSYPTDLTDDQRELVSHLIPPAKKGSRPRTVDMREVLNALLYMVVTGGVWRILPHDFPKWQTVYDYFRNWKKDCTFENMNTQLSKYVRVMEDRRETSSTSILNSQSVQTATMAHKDMGYDANKKKKGRKRHLLVDGGYRGEEFLRWVMDTLRLALKVVLRSDTTKGFVLLPRRWVVERTFGWWNWYRRLSKDYESLPSSSEPSSILL